ncbi:MAG: AraC family transcriptional regulator [Kiritimatiellae bacterium]|nr:AraC family transcriptional regulator [Kiritimatiellia bacterium]
MVSFFDHPPMRVRAPAAVSEPPYFSHQVSAARRFYLRLAPRHGGPLTVISGGWELCRPDYRVRRAGFPHPTLEFVARGRGELWLGGRRTPLTPGSVFVYGRRTPHDIRCDPASPMLKYFVVFAGAAARDLLRTGRLTPGTATRVTEPDRIRELFDDLIARALDDRPGRERLCAIALAYLLTRIATRTAPQTPDAGALAAYHRCRALIESRPAEFRRLAELAAAGHVSVGHLCRLFRKFGRQSPMAYLRHLRMNLAAQRILTGHVPIKTVAVEFGYADPHNFTRAFRRAFGVAPTDLLRGPVAHTRPAGPLRSSAAHALTPALPASTFRT